MTEPSAQPKGRILVVDDEAHIRRVLEVMLTRQGYAVDTAENGTEGLNKFAAEVYDLVFLDLRMPDLDGLTVLSRIRQADPDQTVVMITAYASVETALEAMKQGALDYIGKPFKEDEILVVVSKAVERSRMLAENRLLRTEVAERYDFKSIIGSSPPMQQLFAVMRKVADTKATVLITGESGTGKELVAQAIHANSRRKDREFVAVDCSSLVETLLESELFGHVKGSFTGAHQTKHGFFELANHGTFFFDEISNLSLNIQAKLLRVIQEREFMKVGDQQKINLDIRIISASNSELTEAIRKGTFREDLYYRLSVVPIHLPPLRERKQDIPLLIRHYIDKLSHKMKKSRLDVSSEAMDILTEYAWPGNVRELEHTMERILILEDTDMIRSGNLPTFITQRQGELQMFSEEPVSLEELEKKYISFVLKRTRGKKTEAADILGINRKTLAAKIQKYGIV